jgi:hypothetical protein
MHLHTHTHTYIYIYIIHTHMCIHKYMLNTHIHTCIHVNIHTYIHACINVYIHNAKMAYDVYEGIENALNVIVSTTESSRKMKKELKTTIFDTVSILR